MVAHCNYCDKPITAEVSSYSICRMWIACGECVSKMLENPRCNTAMIEKPKSIKIRLGATHPMTSDTRRQLTEEARKALRCLYLAANEDVARDVGTKVGSAITALEAENAELRRERDEWKRLWELRGKALARPCLKCGYVPAVIKPMKGEP